ncbi:MAG: acyl-CoA synthetase FdrA [Actinomycetota bacterium]|nr:acyl-CoA synthetase FdrA [Actinomycetota bacterium]
MSLVGQSVLKSAVFPSLYRDSVTLMMIASKLQGIAGVERAGVVMATPANLEILATAGMLPEQLAATPDDLVIVVRCDDEQAADVAIAAATEQVAGVGQGESASTALVRPGTLAEGVAALSGANLLSVSTPGAFAPLLIKQGLQAGLHVFCFSDNIAIADEVALKELAVSRGLLLMGPDCGTALIDGAPLGFVNAVSRGPVGIVSASGTGAQEVMCQLDAQGVGVSQVIGVGGRDLSAEVGASMTNLALDLLSADEETVCIIVIGKPPAPEVAEALLAKLAKSSKPVVVCLIGNSEVGTTGPVTTTATLADAATAAAILVGAPALDDAPLAVLPESGVHGGGVLGLYTGGTLASEAKYLLRENGVKAEILDLGDDEYTVGRPHPMIDPSLRASRVAEAGADPSIGIVLVDLVLGFGSSTDPGTPLAQAAVLAQAAAKADGRVLHIVASICGTSRDPQSISGQRQLLLDAGVIVAESNAAAVRTAVALRIVGA